MQGAFTFKELFDFSRRSEDSANFVREFTASLTPRIQISVSESEGKFGIALDRPKHSTIGDRFEMILPNSKKAQKIQEKASEASIETISINNSQFGFHLENEYHDYQVIVPEDVKKDGLVLLEHLKDIFSAELKELAITPGIVTGIEESSKSLTVDEGKVTHVEMIKYLEDKSEKKILMCTPEPSDFSYHWPIVVDQLVIQNSQWFNRNNLLNLNCSRISLGRSTLTSEDLNVFIKKWVISDNTKFQQLIVSEALSIHRMLDLDVISSGLDTIPSCKKRKTDEYGLPIYGKVKPTTGFDIRRDDGSLATVTLWKEDSGNETFQFEVQDPKKKKMNYWERLEDSEGSYFSSSLNGTKKTHAEMRNLLENGDPKLLSIFEIPEAGFVYDKTITTYKLSVIRADWFTRQNLLNLDCVEIYLEKVDLTNEDVNAFISQWYHSDNKKLKNLSIWISDKDDCFKPDLAVITAGIPTVPGKKRKESLKRTLSYDKKKYEKGLDIIRSDGLEANVLLHQKKLRICESKKLLFTIWHPKEKKEITDKTADKPADKDSYHEDMKEAYDEVDVNDFEMC